LFISSFAGFAAIFVNCKVHMTMKNRI
jgi:hypothetical protein